MFLTKNEVMNVIKLKIDISKEKSFKLIYFLTFLKNVGSDFLINILGK